MSKTLASSTFTVSDVAVATEPLPEVPYYEAVSKFLRGPVESCSRYHGQLVEDVILNPLVSAINRAFFAHHPLILSPDIIWLTITQGLAIHINQNAESLRHHFVSHKGKLKLSVGQDDFIKGSPENPWPEVFAAFSKQIREHIGDSHKLIVADFSTTGPTERAASEIVLLDSMQSYFTYDFMTSCGIPSITLEGTVDDWRSIVSRTEKLSEFNLDWWINPLLPILNQFVAATAGDIDCSFWQSIYKYLMRSGGDCISGWVTKLFPYTCDSSKTHKRNQYLNAPYSEEGPQDIDFPITTSKAPFKWTVGIPPNQTTYDMEFIGGLIGIAQRPDTLALRPEIGWAVRELPRTT